MMKLVAPKGVESSTLSYDKMSGFKELIVHEISHFWWRFCPLFLVLDVRNNPNPNPNPNHLNVCYKSTYKYASRLFSIWVKTGFRFYLSHNSNWDFYVD